MSISKCSAAVSVAVEDVTARLSPHWVKNEEKYRGLALACKNIDSFMKDFDATKLIVEVSGEREIIISVETTLVSVCDKKHPFFSLTKNTTGFGFRVSDEGEIVTEFIFQSIWDRNPEKI